jgi:hypothetical protein
MKHIPNHPCDNLTLFWDDIDREWRVNVSADDEMSVDQAMGLVRRGLLTPEW